MRTWKFIWIFCLASVVTYQSAGQEFTRLASEEQRYLDRALRDAEHEQGLVFSSQSDEHDFWNDQRAFEQALFYKHPDYYRIYLYGKHVAYLNHLETCTQECGHGDYFFRQASFYSQFNYRDKEVLLTLIQLKGDRGWEVSLNSTRRYD